MPNDAQTEELTVLSVLHATQESSPNPVELELSRSFTVASAEQLLHSLNDAEGSASEYRLRVASSNEGGILADLWAAIVVGTACHRSPTDVIAWGLRKPIKRATPFALSPAFIAALPAARSVASESGEAVPTSEARRVLALVNKGLLDPASGSAQTLVEFDPDYPVAPVLRGGSGFEPESPLVRKRLFGQQVLEFRQRLEIGGLRRGVNPVNAGAAGDVGRFLAELHENGAEHGSRNSEGKAGRGVRFLRLRKHVAASRTELAARCGEIDALARHVECTLSETGASTIVEASVSDFGPGIVDGFLQSASAEGINLPRRQLLESLIYERLSSKSRDPHAGLGIQKALQAARRMQAFVSLRTAEFWLTASYGPGADEVILADVPGGPHPPVVGTHWQILWPQLS
jgi:hypothetical protein